VIQNCSNEQEEECESEVEEDGNPRMCSVAGKRGWSCVLPVLSTFRFSHSSGAKLSPLRLDAVTSGISDDAMHGG
jgi:hypothetical protein